MIPDAGTREERKAFVLEHCSLLPCVDEVYHIFTPFQLRRGLLPDHQWKVLRTGSQHVTIFRRNDVNDFQTLRLVHHYDLDEWLEKFATGEIRYIEYDP